MSCSCAALAGDRVASLDFSEGFPPADIFECGPAVVAYDPDPGERHGR